jgi:hypothetical protein
MHKDVLPGNLKGGDHSKDLGVDRKILEWILEKLCEKVWIRFIWLRIGIIGGL